jgi:diguanylate cyclase (GGDEF)-like protein
VEISTYPIFDPRGDVTHVVQYSRDISERKRSEEERTRLIQDLEHISRVDGLTGVLNRRALMESLSHEADRSRRYGFPLSMILCDIDRFKDINDTYGHDEGDRALLAVTRTLAATVRQSDLLGRYGGDEFMVILPATSLDGAEEFAERIRRAVRGIHFEPGGGSPVPLTVSLGVSALATGKGEDVDNLVKRADMALYASKAEGRDSVSVSRA